MGIMMTKEIYDQLLKVVLDGDRKLANKMIDEWSQSHGGFERAIVELINPILETIGQLWGGEEQISLAQAYMAGKIAEDVLEKQKTSDIEFEDKLQKGPIVIGNIEDDFHPLGRKMVSIFLRMSGWKVIDLGNDVTAEEFIDKAEEIGARIIGASAMMYTTAINIKKLRDEIDRRGLTEKIQLAVGGAVFKLRPELVYEVGGDDTASQAMHAPALFDRLWEKTTQKEVIYE